MRLFISGTAVLHLKLQRARVSLDITGPGPSFGIRRKRIARIAQAVIIVKVTAYISVSLFLSYATKKGIVQIRKFCRFFTLKASKANKVVASF